MLAGSTEHMEPLESDYLELSVPAGIALTTVGIITFIFQFRIQLFSEWTWAILYSNLFIILGTLLLFSDVRVYQFGASPTERLLSEATESTVVDKESAE